MEGDGFRHPPWGLFGGEDGATGGVMLIEPGAEDGTLLPSKIDSRPVCAGTVVRDLCPSGGGYGPPGRSDAEPTRPEDASRR